jgi:hypothetical protein
MFTICDVLLVNKIDYLDYENFDIDASITWLKDEISAFIAR